MRTIKAGAAHIVINNEIGTDIQAATHRNKVEYIRDDLEAAALRLETGEETLLFISCDLVGLELDYVQGILPEIAVASGLPPENILIGCSHTHSGPAILGPTCPGKPRDESYLERLRAWLIELGKKAAESSAPAKIALNAGSARIGYNRRCCWADGTHTMHGDAGRADFIGLEGPDDPQHTALFVTDESGRLRAILYNNTAHVTTFYGANFLSADFPGLARRYFRDIFGDIPVLFFNGAIGDISLESQVAKDMRRESCEQKMARAAHLIAGETLRLLHESEFKSKVSMRHCRSIMEFAVRLPPPDRLAWARGLMDKARRSGELNLEIATAFQTLELQARYAGKGNEPAPIHAVALDDFAFLSVPCEFFSHFALRIKARSPFRVTAIFGLTNGDMGYCPTMEGILGGHWGGAPMLASRWEMNAGYRIVDEASRLLRALKGRE